MTLFNNNSLNLESMRDNQNCQHMDTQLDLNVLCRQWYAGPLCIHNVWTDVMVEMALLCVQLK